MKKNLNKSQTTFIALGALLSLLARGQDLSGTHAPNTGSESKTAVTYDAGARGSQLKSQYDSLVEKLQSWTTSSEGDSHSVEVSGDELTVHLNPVVIRSSIDSIKKIKLYRDAVEKRCKGIDASTSLLLNTIDHCLVNQVILPAVNKSKIEQNRIETKISSKAINTCRDELAAYFSEKEKRTDLTEKNLFLADQEAAKSLNSVFEVFGASKNSKKSSIADTSELVKAVKSVEASNLCQVKLDLGSKDDAKADKKSDGKPKADVTPGEQSSHKHHSDYEESTEETFEEEEIYQPLAPKKVTEAPKPIPQPAPKPAPVYQPTQPTYQPVPYKPKRYEPAPAPRQRNNTPAFIPAAAPAPRRALVGGPGPVPIAGVPIARSFGLSLGFGSYNSTITAQPLPYPPPMPMMPMPMPMLGGMGGGLTGITSSPVSRACLVCSSTPTVMPTLGLANMMARPCQRQVIGGRPVGACLPNMNQPVIGYPGINPNLNQIPRYPGAPVYPGTVNQPSIGGGNVVPSRTTVPRSSTTTTLLRNGRRRLRK